MRESNINRSGILSALTEENYKLQSTLFPPTSLQDFHIRILSGKRFCSLLFYSGVTFNPAAKTPLNSGLMELKFLSI